MNRLKGPFFKGNSDIFPERGGTRERRRNSNTFHFNPLLKPWRIHKESLQNCLQERYGSSPSLHFRNLGWELVMRKMVLGNKSWLIMHAWDNECGK